MKQGRGEQSLRTMLRWKKQELACRRRFLLLLCCAALACMPTLWAAQLSFGQPSIEDDLIAVPVLFEPNVNESVASMQFELDLPGAVGDLLDIDIGPAAAAVNKDAVFTEIATGYRIIVAGFNQDTMTLGEVATLWLRAYSADSVMNEITMSEALLSDPAGEEVAVQVINPEVIESEGEKDDLTDWDKEVIEEEADPELEQQEETQGSEEAESLEEVETTSYPQAYDSSNLTSGSAQSDQETASTDNAMQSRSTALQARANIASPAPAFIGGGATPYRSQPSGVSSSAPVVGNRPGAPRSNASSRSGTRPYPARPAKVQTGVSAEVAGDAALATGLSGRALAARSAISSSSPAVAGFPIGMLPDSISRHAGDHPGLRVHAKLIHPLWMILILVGAGLCIAPLIYFVRRYLFGC